MYYWLKLFSISSCSGGRKIQIQGSNLELVESVTVFPSDKVLKTQYNTSSGVRCVYYFCCIGHRCQLFISWFFFKWFLSCQDGFCRKWHTVYTLFIHWCQIMHFFSTQRKVPPAVGSVKLKFCCHNKQEKNGSFKTSNLESLVVKTRKCCLFVHLHNQSTQLYFFNYYIV